MSTRDFTITEQHVRLLRRMYVGWEDCEFGAPAIDCKRPYGNGDVVEDMAEILGFEVDEDEGVSREHEEYLTNLHREMQTVIQIVLRNAVVVPGTYLAGEYGVNWQPALPSSSAGL